MTALFFLMNYKGGILENNGYLEIDEFPSTT